MIPSAASSRSALRLTIAGFLPPISTMHGRGHAVEKLLKSRIPTSYEPVNTMPSMPGFDWSSSPTVSPGPMTKLTTPAGSARVLERVDQVHARQRRGRRRLVDHRVAGQERAADRAGGEGHREVERADDREHAVRPQDRPGVDRRVAEVVHRVVVEVVVLGRLGVVADQVGGLLDLAERLEPVLADLERHVRAVAHLALGDELRGAAQDLQALLPGRVPPRGRGAARGLDRLLHVAAVALREGPDEQVPIDR